MHNTYTSKRLRYCLLSKLTCCRTHTMMRVATLCGQSIALSPPSMVAGRKKNCLSFLKIPSKKAELTEEWTHIDRQQTKMWINDIKSSHLPSSGTRLCKVPLLTSTPIGRSWVVHVEQQWANHVEEDYSKSVRLIWNIFWCKETVSLC